jgi:hypothetical protein
MIVSCVFVLHVLSRLRHFVKAPIFLQVASRSFGNVVELLWISLFVATRPNAQVSFQAFPSMQRPRAPLGAWRS